VAPIAVETEKKPKANKSSKSESISKEEPSISSTASQGLAALKNLIAKAAAGTLTSKSKTEEYATVNSPKRSPAESPLVAKKPSEPIPTQTILKATTEIQTETEIKTVKDENNDYWMEEKLKMQKDPAYQSFKSNKGSLQMIRKSSTSSKGTSPPPQTISTQVLN